MGTITPPGCASSRGQKGGVGRQTPKLYVFLSHKWENHLNIRCGSGAKHLSGYDSKKPLSKNNGEAGEDMAIIVVTTDGQTVAVSNGDTVIVDIPGGGTVNIVAADTNV